MAPGVAPTVNLTPMQQQGPPQGAPNGDMMGPPPGYGGWGWIRSCWLVVRMKENSTACSDSVWQQLAVASQVLDVDVIVSSWNSSWVDQ